MGRTNLPEMKSCDGCKHEVDQNACCTIVRATREESKRIKRYAEENAVDWQVNEGIKCGFLQDGQCAVYAVRPWACRAMGVVKQIPCSRFPEEAVIDIPQPVAISLKLSSPDDAFLGFYFEPSYYERMKRALKPEGLTVI